MKLLGNNLEQWLNDYRKNDFLRKLVPVLGLDILVKVSGFVLIPVYLRLMSQEEYGSYNFMVSIIQTVGLVLTLGLYIPQTKLYHSLKTPRERGNMLFTIAITLSVFIVLVVLPVFVFGIDHWITGKLFKNNFFYQRYRWILLLALLVTIFGYVLTYFLFTTERIRQVKAYNGWRLFCICLTVVALVFFNKDAVKTRLSFTYGLEFLLIAFFGVYFFREMVPGFSRKLLIRCLAMGLPIMLTVFFGIVVNFTDKFFLEKYGDLKSLSTYYLAFSFASIIPLISASLQNVWMPRFMKEKDLEKNSAQTTRLISRLLLSFIVLGAGIWLLFLVLIRINMIPSTYERGIYILPVLLISQICMAITTLLNNYLIYFEKTYLLLVTGFITSAISILLSANLIPKWGIYGAANTILISNVFYLVISYCLVQVYKRRFLYTTGGQTAVQIDQRA